MTPELYKQIQELILMFIGLLLFISLGILLLTFILKHYDNELTNKKIKELEEDKKDLEQRLKNENEWERMRYEHEEMLRKMKK